MSTESRLKSNFLALAILALAVAANGYTVTRRIAIDVTSPDREFAVTLNRGGTEYVEALLYQDGVALNPTSLYTGGYFWYAEDEATNVGIQVAVHSFTTNAVRFWFTGTDTAGLASSNATSTVTYHAAIVLTNATERSTWDQGSATVRPQGGVSATAITTNLNFVESDPVWVAASSAVWAAAADGLAGKLSLSGGDLFTAAAGAAAYSLTNQGTYIELRGDKRYSTNANWRLFTWAPLGGANARDQLFHLRYNCSVDPATFNWLPSDPAHPAIGLGIEPLWNGASEFYFESGNGTQTSGWYRPFMVVQQPTSWVASVQSLGSTVLERDTYSQVQIGSFQEGAATGLWVTIPKKTYTNTVLGNTGQDYYSIIGNRVTGFGIGTYYDAPLDLGSSNTLVMRIRGHGVDLQGKTISNALFAGDGSGITNLPPAATTAGVNQITFNGTNYGGDLTFEGSGVTASGSTFTFTDTDTGITGLSASASAAGVVAQVDAQNWTIGTSVVAAAGGGVRSLLVMGVTNRLAATAGAHNYITFDRINGEIVSTNAWSYSATGTAVIVGSATYTFAPGTDATTTWYIWRNGFATNSPDMRCANLLIRRAVPSGTTAASYQFSETFPVLSTSEVFRMTILPAVAMTNSYLQDNSISRNLYFELSTWIQEE